MMTARGLISSELNLKKCYLFKENTSILSFTMLKTKSYRSVSRMLTSKDVRDRFIKYFVEENCHKYIPSSSVLSSFDSSVPFVNAGMCQFKHIFLGEEAKYDCVANTQKCIRIGGKHDDLNIIGIDSYHHTFFEMLGNWSFGKYHKLEACQMAWNLLQSEPFSIPKERLYVTYFNGDENGNISPDEETREIWLQLGVQPDHILPFGMGENFWEMGSSGPCGPCTEIHVADASLPYSPHLVNADSPLLRELWNIVFISYNRETEGCLKPLNKLYIDTGMGYERLVAVLQGKKSNYDTDLFLPLFQTIEKISGASAYSGDFENETDLHYRLLADYSRMVTVAVADGAYPDTNPKLKRILRRALSIAENKFEVTDSRGLLKELSYHVAESLGDHYPEIPGNLDGVKLVIDHEAELLKALREKMGEKWEPMLSKYPGLDAFQIGDYPALPLALSYAEEFKDGDLPTEAAYKLYDTYGLERRVLERLQDCLNLNIKWPEVEAYVKTVKKSSRDGKEDAGIFGTFVTDDALKYDVGRKGGELLDATVLAVLERDQELVIVTDKTNFYVEAGGQASDVGSIATESMGELGVKRVEKMSKCILHYVSKKEEINVKAGDKVCLKVDANHRMANARNHTATHLVMAAMRNRLGSSFYCKSAKSNDKFISLHYGTLKSEFRVKEVEALETAVRTMIHKCLPVCREAISKNDFVDLQRDLTANPKDIYAHDQIFLISISDEDKIISKQTCCGTHVGNTSELGHFCITSLKMEGSGMKLQAVTGDMAKEAMENAAQIQKFTMEFQYDTLKVLNLGLESATSGIVIDLINRVQNYQKDFATLIRRNPNAYDYKTKIRVRDLSDYEDRLQVLAKRLSITEMENWVRYEKMTENPKFMVEVLTPRKELRDQSLDLKQFSETFHDVPHIFFSYLEGAIHAVCNIPRKDVLVDFSAPIWMNPVVNYIVGEEVNNLCTVPEAVKCGFYDPWYVKKDSLYLVGEYAPMMQKRYRLVGEKDKKVVMDPLPVESKEEAMRIINEAMQVAIKVAEEHFEKYKHMTYY